MTNFFDKIMFKKLIKMHDQVTSRDTAIRHLKQDIARLKRTLENSTRNLESAHDLFVRNIDPRESLSEQAFCRLMFDYEESINDSHRKLGLK